MSEADFENVVIPDLPGARLAVSHVSKSFGGNAAVSDVSLEAEPGRVTALIGPNGSGKTTLLNLICGFYRIDEGTVDLDGTELNRKSSNARANAGIARTFQTPAVPEGITVREAVLAGRYSTTRVSMLGAVLRSPRFRSVLRDDNEAVGEVLALAGLDHLADLEAASLPLGQRRMLEVARALIAKPQVLLLDEAASGLDEHEVERLALMIRRIRDAGATVILVEHNFRLVLSLADQIYVLARGSLLASGSPAEIEVNPVVLNEYLGVEAELDAFVDGDVVKGASS